ncbi:glycosyltransferase, putative [Ixodes scapularis]|uniref:Mannosyltransferase n=1 Tax=Ixodes scapularis TaxID=6945 RepID=B7PP15_IXOSC|nr:glycosyltransferase, putative [Ixodes scapularis]|eukprot:XP_002435507.1 glycosyltransferase, putative [Ixodes scapularis]
MARQRRKELKDVPRKPLAAQHPRQSPNASDDGSMGPWAPQLYTAFKALFSARLCAAVWSSISDCDETFNYWEPTHFLMYGKGLQTWEYSPVYAIRSYAYLWLHVLPGLFYSSLLQSNRVLVFYFMRCILGFACSLCEVYFYRGVLHRFGPVVARTTLVLLLFSTGMFVSSTAYLPSTFSMYATLVATGGWFMGDTRVTVLATAIGALLAPLAGDGRATTLCLGKEWYRFPSSFFLPENWQLAFLESEFRGQLPKPFAQGPHATRLVPRDMNDQNREERSRYVQASQCDYLVDTDGPDVTEREPNYSASPDWEVVSSIKFLDSKRSSLYGRVFYIPFVTERWCSYVNYNLLRRIKADRG